MKFTKMQGAGNDFIIINNIEEKIPVDKLGDIAKRLCTRRLSIGADGLMVVDNPTMGGDYKMRFYNSDGSIGEMCGNGARCIARYGYEKKLAGTVQHVETTAGMVIGEKIDGRLYKVRLNDVTKMEDFRVVTECKGEISGTYVELGNPGIPHVAVQIDGLKHADKDALRALGKELRWHKAFSKGANVNFYDFVDSNHIRELTYERGVEDFTLACGTGTGSVVATLVSKGIVSAEQVQVDVMGGILYINIRDNNGLENIYLTGPTNIICEGNVTDEELIL